MNPSSSGCGYIADDVGAQDNSCDRHTAFEFLHYWRSRSRSASMSHAARLDSWSTANPVRARMFFGIPGPSPITVSPRAQSLTFDFIARDSAATGTMHFRFGSKAGTIDIDDIRVVDLDDGRDVIPTCGFEDGPESLSRRWTVWPPGAKNTVGQVGLEPGSGRDGSTSLHVVLKPPADGTWPDFHVYHQANLRVIEGHRLRVTLWVRATPERELTIGFYRPGEPYVLLGGPPGPFENQIKLAAGAGVNFVSFPIDLPWPRPGQSEDWKQVDLACGQVLAANPQALLLPRMGMSPPNWWQDEHRDDVMQWENGRRGLAVVASGQYGAMRPSGSRHWWFISRQSSAIMSRAIIPAARTPANGSTRGRGRRHLNGYAPADLRAWRIWLKEPLPDGPGASDRLARRGGRTGLGDGAVAGSTATRRRRGSSATRRGSSP